MNQPTNKVHFVLDEIALLGPMTAIDDALGLGRAYGVRLQMYFQSAGQLKKSFPDGQDQTLFSNTSQVFFGVNDSATADLVSNRLGEETIIVDSGGTSRSSSSQRTGGQQFSESISDSRTSNSNWQQQPRKLAKPEEVIALPPRMAITFTPGVPPVRTWLLRYYEEKSLFRQRSGWSGRFADLKELVGMVLMTLLFLGFAVGITIPALRILQGQPPFPASERTQHRLTGEKDVQYR